jgi:hypothetical protein
VVGISDSDMWRHKQGGSSCLANRNLELNWWLYSKLVIITITSFSFLEIIERINSTVFPHSFINNKSTLLHPIQSNPWLLLLLLFLLLSFSPIPPVLFFLRFQINFYLVRFFPYPFFIHSAIRFHSNLDRFDFFFYSFARFAFIFMFLFCNQC